MPNFPDEASRQAVADDHWSPWPEDAGPGQPPPSIRGLSEPTAESITLGREIWAQQGYQAP